MLQRCQHSDNMEYQHSFKFRINRQRLGSDGKGSIYFIARINGEQSKPIPMHLRWWPDRFNQQTGECSPGSRKSVDIKEAQDISLSLGQELSKARKVVLQARLEERSFDLNTFLEDFNNFASRTDFIAFARKKIEWRSINDKKNFSELTQSAHEIAVNTLEAYVRSKSQDSLKFTSFDNKWCSEYETWLIESAGLKGTSAWRYMKDIRVYMKMAQKDKIHFYYPFQDFELVEPEPNPNTQEEEILDADEEQLLWHYYLKCEPKSRHRRVLQAMFSSLDVGFRISDLERLEKGQIDFIGKRVTFTPWKQRRPTKKRPVPPVLKNRLTDRALLVMKDSIRENSPKVSSKPEENVFDLMAETNSREVVAEICKHVGIKKHVSWHTLRHTCATKLSDAGMNEFQLMDFFAWLDIKTARRYVKKKTATLDDIVSRLNNQGGIMGVNSQAG